MAINVPIVSEFSDRGLKKAMNEFKRLETKGQKTAFALKKAFLPATAALGGLAVAGAKMVAAGEQAATSNSRIIAISKSMNLFGQESEKVANNLIKMANAQAMASGEDQNAIKLGMAKLLTFSEIAKSADELNGVFARTTQVSLDLAAAGFGTVKDNATQLGKALQDPIKGLSALTRSGVTFTRAEQDKIRALVESNNLFEAQDMILKAIEQQVGGTAAATRNATDRIKVSFSLLTEQIGLALLPVLDALLPKIIGLLEFMVDHKNVLIGFALGIGTISAAIVVANFAMKAYAAAQAIATAAQWAFNAALSMNPIGIAVIAIAGLVAGLVVLYKKFESVRKVINAMLAPLKSAAEGLGWLAKKLGIVGDEIEQNFTPSIDEARKQAGDMYASVREASTGLEQLEDTSDSAAGAQDELARSVNAVYDEVRKLNPELDAMLARLDREDQIETFQRAIDDYREAIADSSLSTREQEQALRDVQRELLRTLEAFGVLSNALAAGIKLKFDTGNIEAAIASANRVIDAFNRVKAIAEGGAPASTYVPPRDELGFLSAPPVATTTITPISSITRAPSGAIQNVTVNVSTINPTQEVGEAVVTAIRNYNRTSGSAQFGVTRL